MEVKEENKYRCNCHLEGGQLPNVLKDRPELYLSLLEGEKEILTDADVMRIFRVCRVTTYRWRKQEILPFAKLGRSIFYVKKLICNVLLGKSGYFIKG